jgi:hypothetical protein
LRFGRGVSARPEQTGNQHGCAKEQKLFHRHGDLSGTDFNAKTFLQSGQPRSTTGW